MHIAWYIVIKGVKIRNRYNQVPHLTQDNTCESDKYTIYITNESQEVSSFPAGDHKAAMNRSCYKLHFQLVPPC